MSEANCKAGSLDRQALSTVIIPLALSDRQRRGAASRAYGAVWNGEHRRTGRPEFGLLRFYFRLRAGSIQPWPIAHLPQGLIRSMSGPLHSIRFASLPCCPWPDWRCPALLSRASAGSASP